MFQRTRSRTELNTRQTTDLPLPAWLKKQMDGPYTFRFYAEDPGFRTYWLDQALKERLALGKQIAEFDSMDEAVQSRFCKTAYDKLYNFRYDLENAYRLYMDSKLFGESGKDK